MTKLSNSVYRSHGFGIYRANERHILRSNRLHSRNGQRVGVLVLHGSGGTASLVDAHPAAIEMARRGYLVLGIDAGGLTTWGNDTCLAAIGDGKTYLQNTLGAKTGKIALIGNSMGSAAALSWLRANAASVYCAALSLPIPNVEAVRAGNRGGLQAEIETAYVNNAGWQAARATRNPVDFVNDLVAANVPIRLDYSLNDGIGLPAETTSFASSLGALATLDNYGSVGHTYDALSGSKVADWIESKL